MGTDMGMRMTETAKMLEIGIWGKKFPGTSDRRKRKKKEKNSIIDGV